MQVTGTFTGTIQLETSLDGTNFVAFEMVDVSTLHGNQPTTHTSLTTPELLCANAYALAYVRLRASAWSSGSASVTIITVNG